MKSARCARGLFIQPLMNAACRVEATCLVKVKRRREHRRKLTLINFPRKLSPRKLTCALFSLPTFVMRANNTTGMHDAIRGCASWHDFQGKLRHLSEKQKGDFFEELVKAYLLLEPEYASKLKHVWLHREVPQAVAKKLKLPAHRSRH
jgi:hypothetical protein